MENTQIHPFTDKEWEDGWITKADTMRQLTISDSYLRDIQNKKRIRKANYKKGGDNRPNVCYKLRDIFDFAMIKNERWLDLTDKIIPFEKTFNHAVFEEGEVEGPVLANSFQNQIQTKEFEEIIKKVIGSIMGEVNKEVVSTIKAEIAKIQLPQLTALPALASDKRSVKRLRLFYYYATGVLFCMFLYAIISINISI